MKYCVVKDLSYIFDMEKIRLPVYYYEPSTTTNPSF